VGRRVRRPDRRVDQAALRQRANQPAGLGTPRVAGDGEGGRGVAEDRIVDDFAGAQDDGGGEVLNVAGDEPPLVTVVVQATAARSGAGSFSSAVTTSPVAPSACFTTSRPGCDCSIETGRSRWLVARRSCRTEALPARPSPSSPSSTRLIAEPGRSWTAVTPAGRMATMPTGASGETTRSTLTGPTVYEVVAMVAVGDMPQR